jgi:hypothetical protein
VRGAASLARRLRRLDAFGGGGGLYLLRVRMWRPFPEAPCISETRMLFMDDGSAKGRFVRNLRPGEVVPGIDNPPWAGLGG